MLTYVRAYMLAYMLLYMSYMPACMPVYMMPNCGYARCSLSKGANECTSSDLSCCMWMTACL